MTSMRRRYVASTSLRRHVPAGNLDPLGPPKILNLGPPNILNLPTPMLLVYDLTLAPDVDLPNDSQTNVHSNNVPRHDSSHNQHPQSVGHHKPHPLTRTTFLHYLYFLENSRYANRGRGTILRIHNTIYIMDFFYRVFRGKVFRL